MYECLRPPCPPRWVILQSVHAPSKHARKNVYEYAKCHACE
jgi:hypothetical protein